MLLPAGGGATGHGTSAGDAGTQTLVGGAGPLVRLSPASGSASGLSSLIGPMAAEILVLSATGVEAEMNEFLCVGVCIVSCTEMEEIFRAS